MAQAPRRAAVEHAFTLIVAVQPDPAAPFIPVAEYNIIADPAEFAGVLLRELARAWRGLKRCLPTSDALVCHLQRTSISGSMPLPMPSRLC
jgi:hypothetical protein